MRPSFSGDERIGALRARGRGCSSRSSYPAEVRAGIVRWGKRELRDPALRRLADRGAPHHLVFLGDTRRAIRRIAAVAAAPRRGGAADRARSAAAGAAAAGQRPRLFALEARSERSRRSQAEPAAALAEAGLLRARGASLLART